MTRAITVAFCLAGLTLLIGWPGTLCPDSTDQLRQALSGEFTDWSPPLLAALWRVGLRFGGTTEPMLILQVVLHWIGIGCMADQLERQGHPRLSLAMLAVGMTPMSLAYIGVVMTDTLLASFYIAAFGLGIRFRNIVLPFGLGLLGYLTRANGAFALPPLFLMKTRLTGVCQIVACVSILLVSIPLSLVVSHQVFGAKRTGVERSLEVFDLAGIMVNSGDRAVLPVAEDCYTPLLWDTLETRCGVLEKVPAPLTRAWLRAIVSQPLAYAQHRLRYFNQATFFLVPFMHQCAAPNLRSCDTSPRGQLVDILRKNPFLWPITWLAVGVTLLTLGLSTVPRALCLSGVMYGAGYLIVGVASEFRYFYWTELSVQASIVLQCASRRVPWQPIAFVVSAICIAGYTARLAYVLM